MSMESWSTKPRRRKPPDVFTHLLTRPHAGLLAYRDLDEALGLFDSVPFVFHDSRTGRNIQHHLTALLRQSVYSRLAGYEDVNDAHRLSVDPTMRRITGKKLDDKNAASANTMGRFETQMLSVADNLQALSEVNGRWVERALQKTTHRRIILDMDSSASPVHGEQEASAYNGHFGCTCYHPLFCFNQFGDCEGSMLRPRQRAQCGPLEGAAGNNRGSVREENSPPILSG